MILQGCLDGSCYVGLQVFPSLEFPVLQPERLLKARLRSEPQANEQGLRLQAFPLISVELCCKGAGVSEGIGIQPPLALLGLLGCSPPAEPCAGRAWVYPLGFLLSGSVEETQRALASVSLGASPETATACWLVLLLAGHSP